MRIAVAADDDEVDLHALGLGDDRPPRLHRPYLGWEHIQATSPLRQTREVLARFLLEKTRELIERLSGGGGKRLRQQHHSEQAGSSPKPIGDLEGRVDDRCRRRGLIYGGEDGLDPVSNSSEVTVRARICLAATNVPRHDLPSRHGVCSMSRLLLRQSGTETATPR